jgi:hypothetical protein
VETGAATAKTAMERIVATTVKNFILRVLGGYLLKYGSNRE